MANTETVATLAWPDGKLTKVWRRRAGRDLVFWTGPEVDFPAVEDEYERYDEGRVGINLVDLRLHLLEAHDEHVANTDRDLLAETDELLDAVRAEAE